MAQKIGKHGDGKKDFGSISALHTCHLTILHLQRLYLDGVLLPWFVPISISGGVYYACRSRTEEGEQNVKKSLYTICRVMFCLPWMKVD